MNKYIRSAIIFALTTHLALGQQNSKDIRGKYCEDLGFGWYCFDIQRGGRYKEVAGHSFFKYKKKGNWFWRNDTLILVSRPKKNERDTFFYLCKEDTLYSIYLDKKNKLPIRGRPLTRQ